MLLAVAAMIATATVFGEMEEDEEFPTRWVLVLRRQEAKEDSAAAAVPRQEKVAVQQEETAAAAVPRREKVAVR